MRGPSRGQEGHAVRGPGAAPAGGARLLRRIPRGGRGRHSQPARPRQPVPERRLPSGDRLPGHAIFAFLRAPTGMQWLRRAVHPHAERAIPVGAHVSERGRVAAWAGGISRALQSALDRPALGLPHASPGSPAASCTWSRCMNTLSSVSKKSGAKHFLNSGLVRIYMEGIRLNVPKEPKDPWVQIDPECEKEVFMLKQLTWHYVILDPALVTQQFGQQEIIRRLFEIFQEAACIPKKRIIFPYAVRDELETAPQNGELRTRIVTDFISGMSEMQAIHMYRRLTGHALGSVLHPATR